MNEQSPPSIGRRIATLRKLRGLTQATLAARLHRSVSWVTKVERGERRIDSMVVFRELSHALAVPLHQLTGQQDTSPGHRPRPGIAALAELQRVVDRPAMMTPDDGESHSVVDIQEEAAALRRVYDSARHNFSAVSPRLPGLLEQAQLVARASAELDRSRAHSVLAGLYRLATMELRRWGDMARTRVAIDRALAAAERSGNPMLVGAVGVFIVQIMVQRDPADGVAAAAEFIDLVVRDPMAESPEGMAVLGGLHSYAGLSAARAGDEREARHMLRRASRAAEVLGRDGAAHGVFFGPAYLAVHEAGLLVDLGRPREAIRLGERIPLDRLGSVNRAGYHAAYLARAYHMCGQDDDAVATIADGLRVAPELLRDQAHAGQIAREIVEGTLRRRRHADEQLRRIARYLKVSD